MSFAAGYSRSAIDRAGKMLREFWVSGITDSDEVISAFRAMIAFRETFQDQLSNMGDIGGRRAVLGNRAEVEGVLKRIRKNWEVHGRIRDMRDEAAPSGYRALHVIVVRDGRRIEIQLRTPHEQEWALAVERTGVRLGYGLKEGEGPADLLEYFRLASDGLYLESRGVDPDSAFTRAFEAARQRALPYVQH